MTYNALYVINRHWKVVQILLRTFNSLYGAQQLCLPLRINNLLYGALVLIKELIHYMNNSLYEAPLYMVDICIEISIKKYMSK